MRSINGHAMYNLATMEDNQEIPGFDHQFPDLNGFILQLVDLYSAGKINSWDALEERVDEFFTPRRMDEMELLVPHWCKMASYANRRTLVHVMCVFMGMFRMSEFLSVSTRRQQIMKWVILFHDVEKEIPDGKRDHAHAFRSAVGAARTLPQLGFFVTQEYKSIIDDWDQFTRSALKTDEKSAEIIQDNRKLPKILDGIDQMFGQNTAGALIIKTILFHLSVDMNFWPPASPLTKEEVKEYFNPELTSLLQIMNLGDNDGWNIFKPDIWEPARVDTLKVFEEIEKLISQ